MIDSVQEAITRMAEAVNDPVGATILMSKADALAIGTHIYTQERQIRDLTIAHPSRGVVDEVKARELLAAEYERAGYFGAADDARSPTPSPHCVVTLRAIAAALQAAALPAVPEGYEQQLMALARRCLWLAFVWNDHNFDAAHVEARREAERQGIKSFDEANRWLAAAPAQEGR